MDKPISLSVKDFIIRKMAVKLMMSEKTIDDVINHQFNSANEALKYNNSVEISGFGKFLFNQKKAIKRLNVLLSKEELYNSVILTCTTEERKASIQLKLNTIKIEIEILKTRTNEDVSNLRGVEEQVVAS
jgi:nucleoid DNA-binding protein